MNPRKKSKPNPEVPGTDSSTSQDAPSTANTTAASSTTNTPSNSEVLQPNPSNASIAESTLTNNDASTAASSGTQTPKGKKWLGGSGSWRAKAPAIVKTAKESIGVTYGTTGELPGDQAKSPKDDSPTKFLTKRKSSKGNALPTSITKVNVSSDGLTEDSKSSKPAESSKATDPPIVTLDEPPLPPEPATASVVGQPVNTWGWRSWWSRPDGYTEGSKLNKNETQAAEDARSTPLPGPTPSEEADAKTKGLDGQVAAGSQGVKKDTKSAAPQAPATEEAKEVPTGDISKKDVASSWFWSWSKAQNAQANPPPVAAPNDGTQTLVNETVTGIDGEQPAEVPIPQSSETATFKNVGGTSETAKTVATTPPKSSGWAFWYRDKPPTEDKQNEGEAQKHVGEVAVYNTPSQSNPEAAQFNEAEQTKTDISNLKEPQPATKADSLAKKSFASLRGRPRTKDTLKDTPTSSKAATPSNVSPARESTKVETAPAAEPALKQTLTTKQEPPNLLLPNFNSTYRLVQQPGFWKQLRQYFLGGEHPAPHLHINPSPPRIKKAVAIGVHGFFPAPILQKVLGQPTGTSIKFANAAAAAIKDWTEARGYTPEIEQIALEGEGFIAERVNTLWKLLLNWIDHLKQADFILVACHSQGVPVAMMLVAKLIQFGCVNATRIGVCAMAGVNMGPFIEYKTKYFGPTAAELFEFGNPKSLVSQMYLAALDEVLRSGVRILYVGSIDDQLVSVEVGQLCVLLEGFELTRIVVYLFHTVPPVHLPRSLRRRPYTRSRFPYPPRWFHT